MNQHYQNLFVGYLSAIKLVSVGEDIEVKQNVSLISFIELTDSLADDRAKRMLFERFPDSEGWQAQTYQIENITTAAVNVVNENAMYFAAQQHGRFV